MLSWCKNFRCKQLFQQALISLKKFDKEFLYFSKKKEKKKKNKNKNKTVCFPTMNKYRTKGTRSFNQMQRHTEIIKSKKQEN